MATEQEATKLHDATPTSEQTNVHDTQHKEKRFDVPTVDWEKAANLRPTSFRGRGLTWMVTFVAGTGFTLFGYDQGVMSGLLTLPAFEKHFPNTVTEAGFQGQSNAATLQAFMVAIYELGCLAGALSNLRVGDKLGRRHTISLGGLIMIVGAILQTASVDYAMMLVARVVTGVGNGLLTSTVPAYQSECAKPHRRGQLVLFEGSLITFGIMISYWLNVGFYFVPTSATWRFPLAFQIVFAVIMIVTMYVGRLPESPRFLVANGQHEEAVAVLAALDGTSVYEPEVQEIYQGIVDAVHLEEGSGFKLSDLLHNGKSQNFRRTLLGILAQCFQQISGINLITYYLTSVLTGMGLGPVMARVISGVNGTCYFLTSLIALWMIESLGRRPLMLWTALAQAGTMAILAGLYNITNEGNKAAQGISVLMLFLFNTWFSLGWLGMTWLYPAEVTPLRIRAPANALSTASNWLFNFMVVMATAPMFNSIKWGTYAFFACCNALIIFPVVYVFFPETKKYSLEELDIVFALAHEEGISPVTVSKRGNIPRAGTREAEEILGRAVPAHRRGSTLGRRLSGSSGLARRFSGEAKATTEHV